LLQVPFSSCSDTASSGASAGGAGVCRSYAGQWGEGEGEDEGGGVCGPVHAPACAVSALGYCKG
jgi:hypothetical protein